jgi:hypothetical protein
MAISSLPLRRPLPERITPDEPTGSPAQQAFRQAIRVVEELREQLHSLRTAQAATRQAYWRQMGPLAAATVAARRALYAPLEEALLDDYLSRAEVQQVTELLVHNARSLQERFGEDESDILHRYAPPAVPPPEPPSVAEDTSTISLPHHEQAATAARARREQRARAAREEKARTADTDGQALLQNTKAAYRQLARLHHPDRAAQADEPTQRAQTELMQRITAAYAANDLAALLTLLADAPATEPTAEAEQLLRRYTQALAQQQTLLAKELTAAQHSDDAAPWSGSEKQQRTRLRQLKRDLRAEIDYLDYLLRQVANPTTLKTLLRELNSQGQRAL